MEFINYELVKHKIPLCSDLVDYIYNNTSYSRTIIFDVILLAADSDNVDLLIYLDEKYNIDLNTIKLEIFNRAIKHYNMNIIEYLRKYNLENKFNNLAILLERDKLVKSYKLVEYLCKYYPDIINNYVWYLAADFDSITTINILDSYNIKLPDLHKMLCIASKNGSINCVEYLYKKGVDIKRKKNMALRFAAENGHLDVVKSLHRNGADINDNIGNMNYAMSRASHYGHLEVVKYLHQNGVHLLNYYMELAAQNDHINIVKYMADTTFIDYVDIKSPDNYSLIEAIKCENINLVKYLCENGANITFYGNYAIRTAAWHNYYDIVVYLNNNGADIRANNNEIIKYMHGTDRFELFKYLVRQGMRINIKDGIVSALYWNQKRIADYLIQLYKKLKKKQKIYKKEVSYLYWEELSDILVNEPNN
jgi:ankyrin repeat protein